MSWRSTFLAVAGSITFITASTAIGERIDEYCETTWRNKENKKNI